MLRLVFRSAPVVVALALSIGLPATRARAFEPFALQVPCRTTATNTVGTVRPCITCHNNPDGGSGCATPPCHNPFGTAFLTNGRVWNETLALMDSDGDGYTNGEELGDPLGTWRIGMPSPATCDCATRPGYPSYTPGDADADMDGYCCRGRDLNSNGDCLGTGEHDATSLDCNERDAMVHSGAAEICSNTIDNDCDGAPTLLDSDCASVVDRDGDGYCPMGRDNNRDRDCIDAGEMTTDVDCNDDEVTVSPAAHEFCIDGLDNDCDMLIDTADPECTSDSDADGDGYCPLGRDIDGNGDCNGVGEATAGFDCDDTAMDVHPGATEICTDFLDNDCDGLADFRDTVDCGSYFDADGDGYCPGGRDGNGNGNCADPGEDAEPGDCDDTQSSINPGMMEICTNDGVDDDCDGLASLADPDCSGWIDSDGDTFCFVGVDSDGDGTCVDMGEATGRGDCDEADPATNPAAIEICTDGIDNDCDGSTDSNDRGACSAYRDTDHDGWCLVGQDLDLDGDCSDAGEQGDPHELTAAEDTLHMRGTEGDPTRYPGAPENCLDRLDNDLDGLIDEAASCTRDVDADMDGWCPIGQDMNMDGDCLDDGENVAGSDCNDGAADINPGQAERCLEWVDADCDGDVGVADSDCFVYLDRDGDGFCGMGIDDNADGDCLDEGEDRFGLDCDDRDPAISTRAREVCDDGVDNDCDGDIDRADSQCPCMSDADCDDGDACTTDTCSSGMCASAPGCVDGGGLDGGVGPPEPGCNCRAVGGGGTRTTPWALGLLALAGLWLGLRRRREGARWH